ncbi:DUF4105 domain-containing protein [Methylolobus aquaticus]|nr:DUF4105 domain-containing protein [Methylolobus aquaticus]
MRRGHVATTVGWVLCGLAVAIALIWSTLAVYYLAPGPESARTVAAGILGVLSGAVISALVVRRTRWWALGGCGALFAVALTLWFGTRASNDRDWQPEVAVLPYATFDGDLVTVHNIRNFDYRSETDFTPAYYDRTFDLRRLDRLDLLASYWMGPDIAHLFLSFGFGEEHLAVSIEARKDRTKPYATLPGFFRQYELVYIAGDERDLIRVRTNYRKDPPEQVYLFRLTGPIENARRIFVDYLRDMNTLRDHPRFYNTLTTNCTTMILAHTAVNPGHLPYSWKILASGHAPEYAYENGRLDSSIPFEQLMQRAHINAAAQAADQSPDFSQRIRAAADGTATRP